MNLSVPLPGSIHILVVEDAPQDYELLQHELQRGGLHFSSTRVDTLDELARELDEQPPAMLLCDHGNARLDSFGVLKLVRARTAVLPFIVVTGALDDVELVQVLERGADDCVFKHRLPELTPAVHRALRLGEARRRLALAEEERDRLRIALNARSPGQSTTLPICAGCKKIREPQGTWRQLELHFREHFNIHFSHGLCPHCMKEYSGGVA